MTSTTAPSSSEARALPLLPLPARDEMERAYLSSDAAYDGIFFLAVRTTGIFCRPSCPARKPLPENVEFFATPGDAVRAGYRACRRCRPLDSDQAPEWVRQLLDRVDDRPDQRIRERDLRAIGVEPAKVRRYFLARYGLTFQAYCRAHRLARAFERIREGAPLDDAVFDTGYTSHSGFRDAFQKAFGQPPGRSSEAGCVRVSWIDTPIGSMIAGATDEGLCLLEFADRPALEGELKWLSRRFGAAVLPAAHPHLATIERELAEYFAGLLQTFTVPVALHGTPFETSVWRALCAIPYGETRSYEAIAREVGRPQAVRAVGRANGLNRIAIVVPCHRVLNKNGGLCGYGGGLWRKRRLLHVEGCYTSDISA